MSPQEKDKVVDIHLNSKTKQFFTTSSLYFIFWIHVNVIFSENLVKLKYVDHHGLQTCTKIRNLGANNNSMTLAIEHFDISGEA